MHVFVLVAAAQDLKSPVLFSLCRLILCDRCSPPGGIELELFSNFFLLKHMNQLRAAALAADAHARSSSLHVEPSAGKELMLIMSRAGLAGIKTGRVASSWVGVSFQAGAIRRGGLVDTVGLRHKCSLARRAGNTGMAHFCIKLLSDSHSNNRLEPMLRKRLYQCLEKLLQSGPLNAVVKFQWKHAGKINPS